MCVYVSVLCVWWENENKTERGDISTKENIWNDRKIRFTIRTPQKQHIDSVNIMSYSFTYFHL